MRHFLLIYDHKAQKLRTNTEFSDKECDAATDAYQAAEREHRDDSNIEIVLIGADSLSTVERTHGHYFDSQDRLARYITTPA
ncbi:MAG: hypothetical protein ACR2KK_10315 [Acidimicrobiales bacterium]